MELAHPELTIVFVEVEGWDSPGSGPGASLLACQAHLTAPFFLACCDTLWDEIDRPALHCDQNWIAVAEISESLSSDYCNAEIGDGKVSGFHDKQRVQGDKFRAFTGVAHIAGTETFFRSLETSSSPSYSLELADGFKGLFNMSSFHHVRDGTNYPAVLLIHGVNDPRVEVWQSAKMAARLQAATANNLNPNPVLLRLDYDAGHGVGSSRSQRNVELADIYSFLLWQFGAPEFQPK